MVSSVPGLVVVFVDDSIDGETSVENQELMAVAAAF